MKTKAAVLYELNKPLVIEELEIPSLEKGQVLVKILYSGICHSQINEIKGLKGEDKYLPHLLGHEGSGIVEEIGPGITKVRKGDYVVLSWIKGTGLDAPSCQYNKDGLTINSGAITTFSEYAVISENRLVVISKEVPPDIAALLGCAIPTGAGIIKNEINLKKEDSLAIFGLGGIGSSALIYASSLSCSKIIAVDINDSKLNFAKEIGATDIINASKVNPVEKIKELTFGKGVDFSIESSGVSAAMENAFESTKDSGKTIIAGNLKSGEKMFINPFDLIRGKRIIGTWGGKTNPDVDIPFYAKKFIQEDIMFKKLITKIYNLNEINDAFNDLKQGRVVRALIKLKI